MPNGTWTRKTPVPSAISEVGVAQAGGNVYIIGGSEQNGETTASNMMYDPAADRWELRAPFPVPLHHIGVAELGGMLYGIGGLTRNVHLGPQRRAFAYDPVTDRWSELPSLSSPRGSAAVAALDGKIHVIGGRNSAKVEHVAIPGGPALEIGVGTVTTHEAYDPASGRWEQRAPLPGPPRDHMGVAAFEGAIHVFGGRINDYTDMLDRHDVYDPAGDRWTTAAPLPRPRSAGAFTVLDGLIIYAGGECKPGGEPFSANAFDDVDAYDSKTDRWLALTPLPEGRHAFGAATVDGIAYFAGGALLCGGGATRDLFAFTLSGFA